MAFSTTSKYVQLTPYLLMEYMYADAPDPEVHFVNTGNLTVGYDKLINGYLSNSVQIFNPTSDSSITNNTPINSVVQTGTNSFVTLDSNLIVPFNDYSDYLTSTNDLPIIFPSNLQVVYDSVRYHIRAGYNLSNIDGLILKIEYQDQNLNFITVSQILIKKGTEQDYELNPNPVTIGSNIYDKYLEIKIPNLKSMNDSYESASSSFQPQTLAALISQSGQGFVVGAPIRISAWQVQNTSDYQGYEKYGSAMIAVYSLEQEDPFSNIGAVIQESDKGQFFEYFATDNEGFIEDFILFQNSIGNAYYISHQIEVLEQIGASIIGTSRFESIQTTAYDTPNYYRPIVRNASFAAAFFLRYTMTLVNSVDESRVARIATYSSTDAGKWGTSLTPIKLSNLPQVQKIYNRVYSQSNISLGNTVPYVAREIVKYTNVFIQQSYVTATSTSLNLTNGTLTQNNGTENQVAKGTGKLVIDVSPFDNYLKFKFVKSGPEGIPTTIDLSNSGLFKISFLDKQGNKTYVPALNDNNIARPALGELAFKIDESTSSKIIQFSDNRFFITNGNPGSGTDQSGQEVTGYASGSVVVEKPTVPINESSSVIYWGYWKKTGDADPVIVIGATGGTGSPQLTTIEITSAEKLKNATEGPAPTEGPTATTKDIQPPDSQTTEDTPPNKNNDNTGGSAKKLTGNALISALSAQISGFIATGWDEAAIVEYFLIPGAPGYVQYQGITKEEFIKAAEGILSSDTISSLDDKL